MPILPRRITSESGGKAEIIHDAQATIDFRYWLTHEGKMYEVSDYYSSNISGSRYWTLLVPDTYSSCTVFPEISVNSESKVEFFEAPTIDTYGTEIDSYNKNRSSSLTTTISFYKNTVVTDDGLPIATALSTYMPVGDLETLGDRILDGGEGYIIKVTPQDTEANIGIHVDFFTEE